MCPEPARSPGRPNPRAENAPPQAPESAWTDRRGAIRLLLFIPLVLAGSWGCTTPSTVRLEQLRPAAYDASPVRRLGLTQFEGLAQFSVALHDQLEADLAAKQFYSVTNHALLTQALPDSPLPNVGGQPPATALANMTPIHLAIERGRRAGVDAVLVGAIEYDVDNGIELGGGVVQIGNVKMLVVADYQLIELPSGEVLLQKSAHARFDGEVANPQDKRRQLDLLVKRCGEQIAMAIAPHAEVINVPLPPRQFGSLGFTLGRAKASASQGNWLDAAGHYRDVIATNPDSHAAHYGLGLTQEAMGDFRGAEESYQRALALDQRLIYQEAQQRLQRSDRHHRMAMSQIHRPR